MRDCLWETHVQQWVYYNEFDDDNVIVIIFSNLYKKENHVTSKQL